MLMLKSILFQVQARDWFVTVDMKDAYFHIQIIQRHKKFLRFTFRGKAYHFRVVPFGLALVPLTFSVHSSRLVAAPGLAYLDLPG